MKPVCLVLGAGAGIGGTVGKRFAREGYHAVLCRRSDEDGSISSLPTSNPRVVRHPGICSMRLNPMYRGTNHRYRNGCWP